jgi:hypothetical protein
LLVFKQKIKDIDDEMNAEKEIERNENCHQDDLDVSEVLL